MSGKGGKEGLVVGVERSAGRRLKGRWWKVGCGGVWNEG